MNTQNLSGVRIWLSGSNPYEGGSEESNRLLEFTRKLAVKCFSSGAYLIHGCHPSLMEVILSAAKEYREKTGRTATLRLVASAAYQEPNGGFAGVTSEVLHAESEFRVTPKLHDNDSSLKKMRDSLASEADVLVAIGGKWWIDAPNHAGVPAEFKLAIDRGIPSFLLGGLGGATSGYLQEHQEIFRDLRNGLDQEANEKLAQEKDTDFLVVSILDQISRLPMGRKEVSLGQSFRILSLDGGGIRGVFTAAVLAKWEELTGHSVANHFDLIAGTSTGGILAIGLGLGLSPAKMVEFYSKHGSEIFPMMRFRQRIIRGFKGVIRSKFDASVLEKKLDLAYGEGRLLEESAQRLLITSYNMTSSNIRLYRTSHHPSVSGHDHLNATTIARATSAAPTYFSSAIVDDPSMPHEAVDGGVWANSPVLSALSEAVGVLNIPLSQIEMLSVGTTDAPSMINVPKVITGKIGWVLQASDLFMKSQMQAALYQVKQLLGASRFYRIDDSAACDGLDDIRSINMLISKGNEIAEQTFEVASHFINGVEATAWR